MMNLMKKLLKLEQSQYSEYNHEKKFLRRLIDILVVVMNCRINTVPITIPEAYLHLYILFNVLH